MVLEFRVGLSGLRAQGFQGGTLKTFEIQTLGVGGAGGFGALA